MNQLWIANYEIYVEEKHADYLEKASKHRLEQEALQTRVRPANWLETRMLNFGSWLIEKGEWMHKRYEKKKYIPRFHESIKLAR